MTTTRAGLRWRHRLAAAAALALGTAAMAQADLAQADLALMRTLRGSYAIECGKPLSPQLAVLDDRLLVQDQGKVLLSGRRPAPAAAGAYGPDGFVAALTSEVAPGEMMDFVFTRDASGLHVTVDGNARVMQTLPAALHGRRIRRCDP